MHLNRVIAASLVLVALGAAGVALAEVPTKRKADKDAGGDLYRAMCWQCHGTTGHGDGPAAAALSVPVPDLRIPVRDEARWDDLVEVILQGRGPMPGYQDTFTRPDARRILVYLEHMDTPADPADDAPDDEDDDPADERNAPEGGE